MANRQLSTKQPKGYTLNRLRHGARLSRLSLGNLPKPLRRVSSEARQYRRDLEEIVIAVKGEVSPIDAHHIDAAAGYQLHGAIVRWLLLHRLDTMTTAEVIKSSEAMARARVQRNACLSLLALDADTDSRSFTLMYPALDVPVSAEYDAALSDATTTPAGQSDASCVDVVDVVADAAGAAADAAADVSPPPADAASPPPPPADNAPADLFG